MEVPEIFKFIYLRNVADGEVRNRQSFHMFKIMTVDKQTTERISDMHIHENPLRLLTNLSCNDRLDNTLGPILKFISQKKLFRKRLPNRIGQN